jgi:hypothetical protein
MSDNESMATTPTMTVGKAFVFYLGAAAGMFVVAMLALSIIMRTDHPTFVFCVAFAVYLMIGLFLSRTVLRGLIQWHPAHDTLERVSHEKAMMLLFWPYKYLDLFFQLMVSKHL